MKSSKKQASTGQVASAFIAIAVIIGASGFAWYWINAQKALNQEQPKQQMGEEATVLPTPTPTQLFHGKDTYIVSRGSQATGPNISEISLDPLDPAVGAKQVLFVKVTHDSPITDVTVKLRTDTKTTNLTLVRTEGSELGGTWMATWTVPESYLYNYTATIIATSAKGEATIPITIRERK